MTAHAGQQCAKNRSEVCGGPAAPIRAPLVVRAHATTAAAKEQFTQLLSKAGAALHQDARRRAEPACPCAHLPKKGNNAQLAVDDPPGKDALEPVQAPEAHANPAAAPTILILGPSKGNDWQ